MYKNFDYISNIYSLKIKFNQKNTQIFMQMILPVFSTDQLLLTKSILDYYLPSIYKAKCFNDGELPFRLEVKNTEVGHLFEHILLEYLCIFKIKSGYKKATYMGETCWNWNRDRKGSFKITISSPGEEKDIFKNALKESILLLNLIIKSEERSIHPSLSPLVRSIL